jgi:hypothetical protein
VRLVALLSTALAAVLVSPLTFASTLPQTSPPHGMQRADPLTWLRPANPMKFGLPKDQARRDGQGSSATCRPIGAHHLTSGPHSKVLELQRTEGLLPPGDVTVYADGRIAAAGVATVRDPHLQLSADTLKALLKLAEAEGFFSLPPHILCQTRETDVRVVSISIFTKTGTSTVSKLSVCPSSAFDQLYSALVAVTGSLAAP